MKLEILYVKCAYLSVISQVYITGLDVLSEPEAEQSSADKSKTFSHLV